MYITEAMRNVCFQRQRRIHIKIELLNFQFQVVDELSGVAIDTPSVSEDCESDVRRTCNISMVVKDSSFEVTPGGKIWLDKYIRLYYGIENIHNNNDVVWFNMGIYLINQPSYSYDATSKTLSFEGVDLMSKLTGMRNGQLEGVARQIPSGSTISEVIIDTLKEAGFEWYLITIREGENTTQYDIDIDAGSYVYDILTELRDIYVTYQMYFDVDGVFHFEPIPTGANLTPVLTYSEINKLMTSYNVDVDFENVKNYIEVYGTTYEADYYAVPCRYYTTTVAQSGSALTLTIDDFDDLEDGDVIGFYASGLSAASSATIKINSGTARPITLSDGTTATSLVVSSTGFYLFEWDGTHNSYVRYAGIGMYEDDTTYHMISSSTVTFANMDFVSFTPQSAITNPKLQFNNNTALGLFNEDMETYATITFVGETYVAEYEEDYDGEGTDGYLLLGTLQITAIAEDDFADSPFYTEGTIGKIRLVLAGDEYDNILTNKLAQDRADFELWNYCRLQDTITIEMLPVPFLNTYDAITFKSRDSEEAETYLIKNISTNLSYDGMQTITAYKYYPYAETVLTLTYNMNGHGTQIAPQSVWYGRKPSQPSEPYAEGYIFGGWYTEAACLTQFDWDVPLRANTTLYAKWTLNAVVATFDMQGHGTQIASQTLNILYSSDTIYPSDSLYPMAGGFVTRPTDPTATGYTFGGWYTTAACTTAFDFNTEITSDTTLYAKWTAEE